MRALLRFVARLLGATLVTTVVLISLTATAAAARARGVLATGHVLVAGTGEKIFLVDAPAPRLEPAVGAQPTPWTVVSWLAAGMLVVAAAGVMLTVVARLRAGRSGTSR